MNSSAPSTPLNLVSTDQIQKYLEENKNLIMAILESQQKGKVAECAQYQANLQKNLMYLAAIADAQPQDSAPDSQLPAGLAAPRGNPQSQMPQAQASPVQPQLGSPMAKLPFQFNALRPQDQQNQLQFLQQRQMQGQVSGLGGGGGNNGLHLMMQPGAGNSGNLRDMKGNQPAGLLDAGGSGSGSGDGQRNSGLGPMQGGR